VKLCSKTQCTTFSEHGIQCVCTVFIVTEDSSLSRLLSPATLLYIFSALSLSSCHSPSFPSFTPDSESEIYKILSNCPNKQSDSDPIPTWLLKQCSSVVVSTVTNIVILSLTSGQFLSTLKESVISPMLKKPTLDKEELSNYRPISNLSLISKLIERVVISRLMDHLTSNSFLN